MVGSRGQVVIVRTPNRVLTAAAMAATCVTMLAGTAMAYELPGRSLYWPGEKSVHRVQMGDPWIFRGSTAYEVVAHPGCWSYSDHRDLVVDVTTAAPDWYAPFPTDPDSLFFPVSETVTIDWHNTTTGQGGRVVGHGDRGNTIVGVPGGNGVIEMDIHLRSDHPWLQAVGSTHLPIGHAEGMTHATVDLTGKACP